MSQTGTVSFTINSTTDAAPSISPISLAASIRAVARNLLTHPVAQTSCQIESTAVLSCNLPKCREAE